jgi:hypothetical protein
MGSVLAFNVICVIEENGLLTSQPSRCVHGLVGRPRNGHECVVEG